jgi:pilus assembly protein CpaE
MSVRNRDVCVVIGGSDSLLDEAVRLCLNVATIRVEGLSLLGEDWSPAAERIASERPSLVIICLNWDVSGATEFLKSADLSARKFVVVGPSQDADIVLRMMRLGVADFVPELAIASELGPVVKGLTSEPDSLNSTAPIIAVMGAKGGVGTTLTVCQTAFHLAERGERVAILDLAYPTGDVALFCDLQPRTNLGDLARAGSDLSAVMISEALCHHSKSDIEVLAAPTRIEDYEFLTAPQVEMMCQVLQERFDWVIVDIPRTWSPIVGVVVDRADQLLLQITPDVPSLAHATEQLELCRRIGISEMMVRVILAREGGDSAIPKRELKNLIGRDADHSLPNDFPAASAFANEGRPLSAVLNRKELARSYSSLVTKIMAWQGIEPDDGISSAESSSIFNRVLRLWRA